jgi:glyoxylase-like metal-dependent hydrolase (beta-lactamase superfamily II)
MSHRIFLPTANRPLPTEITLWRFRVRGFRGVFLVDTQFAPLTEELVAAIKQISDGRIRFVVNTHQHGDHTGGNGNFAKLGVVVMARDELRAGLAKGNQPPAAAALPMLTYRGPVTVHMNGEEVQLIPVPVAHTNGDTMVRFPVADVLMTGDFHRSVGYPNIDRNNGGSLKSMVEGLNAVIQAAGPNTKIIPGHGPVVDKTGVAAHRDMIMALRDRVAQLIQQGKTVEEATVAKLTSDYDTRVPGATPMTADRFVGQLYAELRGIR